jgi:tetratricopeptide (TPR) repeat protein
MKTSIRSLIMSSLVLGVILLPILSCKKHEVQAPSQPDVIRIQGVNEPPELLVPAEKKFVHTEETDALGKAVENIKNGSEATALPALDAFVAKYPQVGDTYSIRAAIRCMTGDLQGAKADVEKALSGPRRLLSEDPNADRPEMLAMHAKLSLLANDDQAVERDIRAIIEVYSSDVQYLTDGHVKLSEKPNSACGWAGKDVEQWLQRSHNAPDSQVFRGMYVSAFASLDDEAKILTERYMADLVTNNPSSPPAYFYAAVGAQKVVTYKSLAFSDAERAAYNNHIIELYSKAIQLNPRIEKAFAERAEARLEQKDYASAVSDYDHAIALAPKDAALWNDRGLAKQETYDKDGAIADYSHAIEFKTTAEDFRALSYSLDNRGDLYTKLGSYKKALSDYTSLIGFRLHDIMMSINLDFFRGLYPEYAGVEDAKLKDKLHRMYYPNFSNETFEQVINKPEGMHPSLNGFLPDAYLKRADVELALKNFSAAHSDYVRSQLFAKHENEERWRVPPGLQALAVDVKTLDAHDAANVRVWVKPADNDGQPTDVPPTEFVLDCNHRTVQTSNSHAAFEPAPGSPAETVRDYFCATPH